MRHRVKELGTILSRKQQCVLDSCKVYSVLICDAVSTHWTTRGMTDALPFLYALPVKHMSTSSLYQHLVLF